MKKTNKKGFTIVELVIVIAVIAILAAVLIPNISRLVKKANQSADIQLVRNMNTALQIEGDGATHYDTAHDAIVAAAKAGYDLTKIAVSDKDNAILWDEKYQCFAYLKSGSNELEYAPNSKTDGEDTPKEQLWMVYNEKPADGFQYSVYWNGGEMDEVTVNGLGFDVGYQTVGKVIYKDDASSGKTVVIRTNGGDLSIDAPKDTVHHYDFVMTLSVDAVSESHCYYEHGFVGTLAKFESGKFVATGTTQFFQSEDAIATVLNGKADLTTAPKYEQNKYDDNGFSLIDGKAGPNHVHKLDDGKVIKASSCGEDGELVFKCIYCDYTETKTIPATGLHTWGTDNKCVDCGVEKSEDLGEVTLTVDTFLALKNIIEGVSEKGEKEVKFVLGANLATDKTSYIRQGINTKITLDLNGYTLVLYNSKYDEQEQCYTAGFIVSGEFEIYDSSEAKTGKIVASRNADNDGNGGLITVQKSDRSAVTKANTQFILTSGVIDSTNNANGCAIMMWHSGGITVNGGSIKAKGYAISGSNKDDSSWTSSRLVVNEGTIESTESYAIYHPQYISADADKGKFAITGGKVSGKMGAIYLCDNTANSVSATAGNTGITLEISGGTLISEGDCVIYVNSTYLSPDDQNKCNIVVTGGSIEAKEGAYFVKAVMNESVKLKTGSYRKASAYVYVRLKGGTFVNLSQNPFIYRLNYTTASKTAESREQAKAYDKNYRIDTNADGTWSVNPAA